MRLCASSRPLNRATEVIACQSTSLTLSSLGIIWASYAATSSEKRRTSTTLPMRDAAPKTRSPWSDESSFFGLDRSMELLGDDRVVAPPSSKRVTEERWALVGLMRPLLALFGGWGVASSSFRRVAASSCLSSSRSARSCLNSSSRGAEAPAPIAAAGGLCLWLPLMHRYCSQGCPFGVTARDPYPPPLFWIRRPDARAQLVAPLLRVGQPGRPD